MKIIDLFCGIGGLSLGFEQAGFEVVSAVDMWADAVKTYNHNRKGNVAEIEPGNFVTQEGGEEFGGTGGENHGGGGHAKVPGDHYSQGVIEDGNGSFKRLIEVDWRPVLSMKKGYTDVVIYPPKDIASAELQFQIGRESQTKKAEKEDVSIMSCNKCTAEGLKITGVPLKANSKNIIQVSFSDKMSHTLILAVYEAD